MSQSTEVLLLCRDLMFVSKTTATARAAGVTVKVFRDPETVSQVPGDTLLIDLAMPGAIDAGRDWKLHTGGRVVGFVSHVDGETIQKAKAAGMDEVITRGQFSRDLEQYFKRASM